MKQKKKKNKQTKQMPWLMDAMRTNMLRVTFLKFSIDSKFSVRKSFEGKTFVTRDQIRNLNEEY